VEEFGYLGSLLVESLYWLFIGRWRKQPVSTSAVFVQMMQIGISAIPIVAMLAFAIGVMLAIQGIHTLKIFGAENKVVLGIAISITREFASLITGILVAGRSGSALAARIGTMVVNQEIDALRVIGINPVRHLVAPAILGMLVMMPALTVLANIAGLGGAAIYTALTLDMSVYAFMQEALDVLRVEDVMQGLIKSLVFALIIALVGTSNGFSVRGGAEGVGLSTTRSVVLSITYIVLADMAFTYFLTR
jgi:phospholipid/cholesterol/gamma-HCH transport system permease protein